EQDDAGMAPGPQGVERFLAIACLANLVAVQSQQLGDCAARIGIVLHQQDRVLVMKIQDGRPREHSSSLRGSTTSSSRPSSPPSFCPLPRGASRSTPARSSARSSLPPP